MQVQKMTIGEISVYLAGLDRLDPETESWLKGDRRKGIQVLLERYYRRTAALKDEEQRLEKMLALEKKLWGEGFAIVAGVDEAGRGPLAGPVMAAAVALNPGQTIKNLRDSKKLTPAARAELFEQIILESRSYGLGLASREEIDRCNIHAASMLAMNRALANMPLRPDYVIVDGFAIKECSYRQKAVTGGDNLSLSIAAASVLAKVSRDSIMDELHERYPCYGFNRNRGYGTAGHLESIARHGPCPEHRRSFRLGR